MKSEREIVVPSISNVIILMFPLFRDSKSSCKKDAFMSVSKREESMMNDEMGKKYYQNWDISIVGTISWKKLPTTFQSVDRTRIDLWIIMRNEHVPQKTIVSIGTVLYSSSKISTKSINLSGESSGVTRRSLQTMAKMNTLYPTNRSLVVVIGVRLVWVGQ